jgi:hypothetical protein
MRLLPEVSRLRGEQALFQITIQRAPTLGTRTTPLIHWWNKYSAYHGLSCASTPGHSIATLHPNGKTITAAEVNFDLCRTLRVPDSVENNDLPPVSSSAELEVYMCLLRHSRI